MERLERQQAQLELDTLRDAKPVKSIPRRRVQHRLQPVKLKLWNPSQQAVTVVNSEVNYCADCSHSSETIFQRNILSYLFTAQKGSAVLNDILQFARRHVTPLFIIVCK